MSERIMTLFGEEIVPQQAKPAGKNRARKKPEEKIVERVDEQPATNDSTADENSEEQVTKENVKKEPPAPKEKEEKTFVLPDDWKGEKQYYAIGEVARLFNVKTSHIRFWTNEFKLKVRTTRKGDRLFTPDQIRELRVIHHLVKERGFTLSGAKAKMKSQNKIDIETVDLKQSLLQLRSKLMIIRNQLT